MNGREYVCTSQKIEHRCSIDEGIVKGEKENEWGQWVNMGFFWFVVSCFHCYLSCGSVVNREYICFSFVSHFILVFPPQGYAIFFFDREISVLCTLLLGVEREKN